MPAEFDDLDLLDQLLADEGVERSGQGRIPQRPGPGEQDAVLSFQQRRLWFLDQLEPNSSGFNMSGALSLEGGLDRNALEQALREMVRRHETLRTHFVQVGDEPFQRIAPAAEAGAFRLAEAVEAPAGEDALLEEIRRETLRPFDLARGPLFRVRLWRQGARRHVLAVTLHHIVCDGWSIGVFIQELSACYAACASGRAPALAPLPVQYADYAAWQRGHLDAAALEKQLSYWRRQLAGLPTLQLPTDRPRPIEARAVAGGRETVRIGAATLAALQRLAQEEDATVAMVLLAAFQTLLARYSGQDDIVVGTPLANRSHAEVEGLIGFFVNMLVIRADLSGHPTVRQAVGRVREAALAAYAHPDLPFEMLVDELKPERHFNRHPLFQVSFIYQNMPDRKMALPDLAVSRIGEDESARYDLELFLGEADGGLSGTLVYDANLFDAETARRLARHYERLAAGFADAGRHLRLAELDLLEKEERQRIVGEWNATATPFPEVLVHEEISAQAARTPRAVAIRSGTRTLDYAELETRSNQLARLLRRQGVGREELVGLCFDRSPEMVIAILAVLKAGGAYLPLDPGYPLDRLAYMIEDSRTGLLLTDARCGALLGTDKGNPSAKRIVLDEIWETILAEAGKPLAGEGRPFPENLAYVIYTSGSTGRPKGSLIPHRGLNNYLQWARRAYEVDLGTGSPLHSSISFDLTVTALFPALMAGKAVVLVPEENAVPALGDAIRNADNLSLVKLTPAHLEILGHLLQPEEAAGRARVLVVGGEALRREHVAFWRTHAPQTRIINEYGPTETVVGCCVQETGPLDGIGLSVPIGRPIANMRLHVLDRDLNPVPAGVLGELYIGGIGVGRGYLRRGGLTAERFIPDPLSTVPGERLYRTGDVARYLRDGTLDYCGRVDSQVKLRGYRIELGEIESVLTSHPLVREASIVLTDGGDRQLIAYVVPDLASPALGEKTAAWNDEHVGQWQQSYEETYQEEPSDAHADDSTFNIVGWNSSYTGDLLPAREMRVWQQETVRQIGDLRGGRVLEIGCGSGLLLFELAPGCEHYLGLDFSRATLARVGRLAARRGLPQVELLHRRAHELQGIAPGSVDTLVINSVIQYFPGADYLTAVLEGALPLLRPGGTLFLGDIRSLPLLPAFHASIQFFRATPETTRQELRARADRSRRREEELILDPGFFHRFAERHPQIASVEIRPRRAAISNELTKFRYDAVLRTAAGKEAGALFTLAPEVRADLEADLAILAWLEGADGPATVGEFREQPKTRPLRTSEIGRWFQPAATGEPLANDPLRDKVERMLLPLLKGDLRKRLPDYMVPSHVVFLDRLPLTLNGKVDRAALPAPEIRSASADAARRAPRGPEEETVAAIWGEILQLGEIGTDDNFFDLGGHSLLATQVVSRIARAFRIELPLRKLFEAPTIAGLGAQVREAMGEEGGPAVPPLLPLAGPRDRLPLSFAQQRLWFLDQLEPGRSTYHVPALLRLEGEIDADALERTCSELVRRHHSLRTSFVLHEGEAVQRVAESWHFPLERIDLSQLDDADREAEAFRQVAAEQERPFDLARGPLLRVRLYRLGPETHWLQVVMHHIISDGWSLGILIRELSALYPAFGNGEPSPLPEPALQYADYAVWQRRWLAAGALQRQLDYWKDRLAGAPVLDLATDRPRPPLASDRGSRLAFAVPAALADELRGLARRHEATLFMTLLGGFYLLLSRHTGQADLTVGTPIANRQRTEAEALIGFFVNTLALRCDLSGNPTVATLLDRVKEACLAAYAHQDAPFEAVVNAVAPQRDTARSPLFQVMFVLQNLPVEELSLSRLRIGSLPLPATTAKLDLTLMLSETQEGLSGEWEYNTDLFDEKTIARLGTHLEEVLRVMVSGADLPISGLAAAGTVPEEPSLPPLPAHDRSVAGWFEEIAARQPDAVALRAGGRSATYAELNAAANRWAHLLLQAGAGPEVGIALLAERSLEALTALLGILKTGSHYLPLNPEEAPYRLLQQIEDIAPPVLLVSGELRSRLPEFAGTVLSLDAPPDALAATPATNPRRFESGESLAYVMYTSGSTGRPKGIGVPHRAILRLTDQPRFIDLSRDGIGLLFAPLAFDASVLETWGILLNGGTLVVGPPGMPPLAELGDLIERESVNTLWFTSALFNLVVDECLGSLGKVRQILAGGDVLSRDHVAKLMAAYPGCRMINGYGPTENGVLTCVHPVEPANLERPGIPIGRAISSTTTLILDAALRRVPVGVPGDLYTGGEGLARGYFHQPRLTAEAFLPNPYGTIPGDRLYRTGDRARYLDDGTIEFLGRADQQVKIRGFRIDPSEIEGRLRQHPAVEDAVVIARGEGVGKRLLGYIQWQPGSAVPMRELKEFLAARLPDYMVPASLQALASLPLTPNGKIDRAALPEPDHDSLLPLADPMGPRTPVEFRLCRLWSRVLGLADIGVRDNFFELGGHSLLATKLIADAEREFGVRLPLQVLFESGTVEGMAGALASGAKPLPFTPLVRLGGEGKAETPFFLVHPAGGSVLSYFKLGTLLARPCYGIQARGLDGDEAPLETVPELAASYIRAIRSVQPHGPYLLGGHSLGASIAHEIAVQLERADEPVGTLAILDHPAPGGLPDGELEPSRTEILAFIAQQIAFHFETPVRLEASELAFLDPAAQHRLFLDRLLASGIAPPYSDEATVAGLVDVYRANLQALLRYRPARFGGTADLVLTGALSGSRPDDPTLGWQNLADAVRVHPCAGDHAGMLKPPHVEALARQLETLFHLPPP